VNVLAPTVTLTLSFVPVVSFNRKETTPPLFVRDVAYGVARVVFGAIIAIALAMTSDRIMVKPNVFLFIAGLLCWGDNGGIVADFRPFGCLIVNNDTRFQGLRKRKTKN